MTDIEDIIRLKIEDHINIDTILRPKIRKNNMNKNPPYNVMSLSVLNAYTVRPNVIIIVNMNAVNTIF